MNSKTFWGTIQSAADTSHLLQQATFGKIDVDMGLLTFRSCSAVSVFAAPAQRPLLLRFILASLSSTDTIFAVGMHPCPFPFPIGGKHGDTALLIQPHHRFPGT